MNSHTYKRAILATSTLVLLAGLYGTTTLAIAACDPENTQEAPTDNINTPQESSAKPAEVIDTEITELPDKINNLIDKLANKSDVKYYSFTALRGQKLMINDVQRGPQRPYWNIEYNLTGEWQSLPTYDAFITPSLSEGQKVLIRISHPKNVPLQTDNYFNVDFGSAPYTHNIRIETAAPDTGTYFWTKTFRSRIMWSTSIRDSTDHYLDGATVDFVINKDDLDPSSTLISQRVSTADGIVEYIDMPPCIGRHATPPFVGANRYKWRVNYNSGHWHVSVRGNPDTGISPVSITQICDINIVN
jgi:hypothetical protein